MVVLPSSLLVTPPNVILTPGPIIICPVNMIGYFFCTLFFNLASYQETLQSNNGAGPRTKYNLSNWDSRARVFLHEATHIDFLMNAGVQPPAANPYVSDLRITSRVKSKLVTQMAYGVEGAQVLGRYRSTDGSFLAGYFTQRNGKSPEFL